MLAARSRGSSPRTVAAEVPPQAERDRGQLQPAATAPAVDHALVAVHGRRVRHACEHTSRSVHTRAVSSAGRAPALHAGGRRFESCTAHFTPSTAAGLAQPRDAIRAIHARCAVACCPWCCPSVTLGRAPGRDLRRPACKFCSGHVRRDQRMSRGHGYAVCDSAVCPGWATMVSLI